MKVEIKFKSRTGTNRRLSWKKARCECCNKVLTFSSFVKARKYVEKFAVDFEIERID